MNMAYGRLRRSIRRHGTSRTVGMAWHLLWRTMRTLWPDTRVAVASFLAKGEPVIRLVQGNRMILDLNDVGISRELFLYGVHETHSTADFRRAIGQGMVLLEVGANVGYYALIAASQVGPAGKVIALEPSPRNAALLEANLGLNGVRHIVSVRETAAGSEVGTLPFYIVSKSNLCGFINREGPGIDLLDTIDVPVIPVDDILLEEHGVDYFRMDLEGFEFDVIRGMKRTLTGPRRPAGGFIEVHSEILNRNGTSARHFLEHLASLGYELEVARFRGRNDIKVRSNDEFFDHPFSELGYWEAFFRHHDACVGVNR